MEKLKLDIQMFSTQIGSASKGSSPSVTYTVYATVGERTANNVQVTFEVKGHADSSFAIVSNKLWASIKIGGTRIGTHVIHANSVYSSVFQINSKGYKNQAFSDWVNDTRWVSFPNVNVSVTDSQTSITGISFESYRDTSGSSYKGGVGTFDCSNLTIPAYASSFNLNILDPDGTEPYSTGDAGTINFSADGGTTWSRVYNEPTNSYYCGTVFKFKEFQAGTGRELDYVTIDGTRQTSGLTEWTKTQNAAGTVVVFQTKWQQHYLDLNGRLDGVDMGGISPCGTTSVTVDGTTTPNLSDYYQLVTYGKTYSIANPTVATGYTCTGLVSGSSAQSGTMGTSNLNVRFNFTTNKPSELSITRTSSTTTSISGTVSATGLNISDYTIYYKKSSASSYSHVSLGTSTSWSLTNLDVDTDYNIYLSVTNPGGTTTTSSSPKTFSTTLNNPTIGTPTVTNILPFSCTVSASGSVTPSRTLNYRFSKDNGSTWTAYQVSNTYNWTGLSEETSYTMKVQVKAIHTGTNASDTTATSGGVSITTPADQAKISIKINGTWKKGKCWYKKNDTWVKAKKFYIKTNDTWKRNKN